MTFLVGHSRIAQIITVTKIFLLEILEVVISVTGGGRQFDEL